MMIRLTRRSMLTAAGAALAAFRGGLAAAQDNRPDPGGLTLADLTEVSRNNLEALTRANLAVGIGNGDRWEADLEAGTIAFIGNDGTRRTAPVQVVGTYNTENGTWLWGWDHPSVPAPLRHDAALVRDWGQRHGVSNFTTRMIDCSEGDAWTMTAIAAYLARANGAYRGPAGSTLVFMTYGRITMTGPNSR